jgi:LuxR family maltose regulon positive regulatory protein
MNPMIIIQSQLVATKFYVPTSPGMLISRPRLSALLDESLKYPLTLVSAPAGFGKTMLLSAWTHSLPVSSPVVSWVSLDEDENDLQLFWTYILSAFDQQQPGRFTPLLKSLQSPVVPPLMSMLTALITSVQDSAEHLVLILDDYHVITEQQVHATLWYLIERLPPQFHLILATRVDPPLPLMLLRERGQVLEVRTNQLRCTVGETRAFLYEAMGTELPDDTIQEVTARTEGWLVGLQLLALSLQGRADPTTLLEETCGNQHYILDFLTQEVLYRQSQEMQTFLLSTCILEQLTASLCDAVTEQSNSQQMLEQLERANLFLMSLDNEQQWYRYHALFAEALFSQLEQTDAHLVPILHARASRWYAQHHQTTPAIVHAFQACEWHWVADLIEQAYPLLLSLTWGAKRHTLVQLRQWVEQLPAEILACRPHLCLACVHLLYTITPHALLYRWLDLAEMALRASLKEQMPAEVLQESLSSQAQQEQRDLLGKALTLRAYLLSYTIDGQAAFALYEQALTYLSPENARFRAVVAIGKLYAHSSSANDVMAAIENGYQAMLLTQEAKQPAVTFAMISATAIHLIGAGRLHEAERLTQQAMLPETPSGDPLLPLTGWVTFCRAEILREHNELACAYSLATEAISLCEQVASFASLFYLYMGYAVLVRVSLSCGDVEAARTSLQQAEQIGRSMNQLIYQHLHSYFTTIDQVRLWLAYGDFDRAARWAERLDLTEQHLTPFARERQEVARARVLLAKDRPAEALQCLEPARQRATAGQRWGHVIEICLLQALAHQRLHEESQALGALSQAVCLGEPEGYIRSFVDEGAPMADLLSRLWEEQRHTGPTPYLDTLLIAFDQESKRLRHSSKKKRRIPRIAERV